MLSFAEFDRAATAGKPMTVVFFGGSITWGANASDPQRTSYRALMGEYLRGRYPHCPFTIYDAAIGGTGSKLGIFRVERDVLAYKPDLVFLDFTLNDGLTDTDAPGMDSYESILRELIGHGVAVEQIFFGGKGDFGPKYDPQRMKRVLAHKQLAAAYGTATGDTHPTVQKRIEDKSLTLDQIWPFDVVHPDDLGYHLFFEGVRDGFNQAVKEQRVCHLPQQPVFSDTYLTRQRIRLVDSPLPKGWSRAKTFRTSMWFDGLSSRWMDDVAICDFKDRAIVEPLTMKFNGTFVGVFGEADADGVHLTAEVDGKPLPNLHPLKGLPPDAWSFKATLPGRLFVWRVLSDSLPPGGHTLVLHPMFSDEAGKGQLRIESVCVAGS
jgi:lysophospholipase L1-like esterase